MLAAVTGLSVIALSADQPLTYSALNLQLYITLRR